MIREKFPGAGSQRPGGRWAIAYSTNSEKQTNSLTGIDNYAAQMKNADPTKSFRDLIVWQKAHELVLGVNELTKQFPKSEMFGLTGAVAKRRRLQHCRGLQASFACRSDSHIEYRARIPRGISLLLILSETSVTAHPGLFPLFSKASANFWTATFKASKDRGPTITPGSWEVSRIILDSGRGEARPT